MCKSRTTVPETGQVPSLQLTAAGHELITRCLANSPFPQTSEGSEDPRTGSAAGPWPSAVIAVTAYMLQAADAVSGRAVMAWSFAFSAAMACAALVKTHGTEAVSRVFCSSQPAPTGKLPRCPSRRCQPLPPGGPRDSDVAICRETTEPIVTVSGPLNTTPTQQKVKS